MSGDRCGSGADSECASVLFPSRLGKPVRRRARRYWVRRRRCERRALILE